MNNLTYITFDQIMASVEQDLSSYADNGMIDRGKLIKVVRKVNSDIGLKINKEKSVMLEIQDFKAQLPADFMYLEMAVACQVEHFHMGTPIFGTHTEEHNVPVEFPAPNTSTCMNECGGCFWVTQKFRDKVVKYDRLVPLKLTKRAQQSCSENCINFNWDNSAYDIDFVNGELITNFRDGKIFISYLSDMVDDDNNILVLDHPIVTEFYEYSLKKHILENFMLNNDAEVTQKLIYIKNELREARIRAINFVNTPEWGELNKIYQDNRKRFYNKYHRIFDTLN